jgi:hypothetical protein
MNIDNETLLEMINEEELNDFSLFEKLAKRFFHSGDHEAVRAFFKKLRFSFLANNEGYRTQVLEKLALESKTFSMDQISSLGYDSLVGNYLVLFLLLKKFPIIDNNSAQCITDILSRLENWNDVCCFGFPFQEQVILQIDERAGNLNKENTKNFAIACNFLFQIDFVKKSKVTVESFRNIYNAVGETEYSLRANLISALIDEDRTQFFALLEKFGESKICDNTTLLSNYSELWKSLKKLSLPIFFDANNLRYNGVLFNDNFYFLIYKNFDGVDKIIFPFAQVELKEVNKVFDPNPQMFYTPRERYGRLFLSDIYSFREIEKIGTPAPESITAVTSMIEDDISKRIREILKDANRTPHSPVEIVDVLTQNLYVNNTNDLRFSGFILKGSSFDCVHLNDIGGQILKACHSPAKIIFLVYVSRIDNQAECYFIKECESKQKNYCIVNRNDLARLFSAYDVL